VNGVMIPETEVAAGLTAIRDLVADWDPHPTFFEITLALAMRHFAAEDCDAIVLETGMGGRLDATNAIESDVVVVTPVGFDHTQWLGETLEAIASEKAGIIKPARPVLSAEQALEAAAVIESAAREARAPLRWIFPDHLTGDLSLNLAGPHQRANAALAVAAVQALISDISEGAIAAGLATVEWPARFQRIGERVVIDGAHNSHAAAVLLDTWRAEMGGNMRATVIFGGVGSKDTAETLRTLAPLAAHWFFVKVASQRGLPAEELREKWDNLGLNQEIGSETAAGVGEAMEKARTMPGARPILVTGSLYLAGESIALLTGGPPFEKSEQ